MKSLIFTIARNKLVDALRKQPPVSAKLSDLVSYNPNFAQGPMLQELLAKLPVEQREVFALVILGELRIREVAQFLGIPEGTIKSRMYHCRMTLQKHWQRGEDKNALWRNPRVATLVSRIIGRRTG